MLDAVSWLRNLNQTNQYLLAVAFAAVIFWESFLPLKGVCQPLLRRWCANASFFLACRAATYLIIGTSSVAVAIATQNSPIGLLNRAFLPYSLRFLLGILVLDLVRYGRHY